MSDMGVINQEAAERLLFFSKAEQVLKFFQEIQKNLKPNEQKIIELASNVITNLANEKKNGSIHLNFFFISKSLNEATPLIFQLLIFQSFDDR
jgi:hypothetical protein